MAEAIISIPVPIGIVSVNEIPDSSDCGYISEVQETTSESEVLVPLSGEAIAQDLNTNQQVIFASESPAGTANDAFGFDGANFYESINPNLIGSYNYVATGNTNNTSFNVGANLDVTVNGSTTNNFFNTRLETIGVWNNLNTIGEWIGFSRCLDISQSGQYWVGLAGDNRVRFSLNGTLLVQDPSGNNNSTQNFNYWHVFPVDLSAGENVIVLEGMNNGSKCGFGCDIVGPFFPGDAGYIESVNDLNSLGEQAVLDIYANNIVFSSEEVPGTGAYFDTQQFTCDHIVDPSTNQPADCIYNTCTGQCICGDAYMTQTTVIEEIVTTCGGTDCWTITVVDQGSGLPVSGYDVLMGGQTKQTNENGIVEFNELASGTYLTEFGGVSSEGNCSELHVVVSISFPAKNYYCVIQNLANKLIRNCDICKDYEIQQFLEIYSLYRILELGQECEDVKNIEAALDRLIINLDCTSCKKCI